MIITLLRRDPAIKQLPVVLTLASALGLLLGATLLRSLTSFDIGLSLAIAMTSLLTPLLVLCYRRATLLTRFGEWEAVLPLDGTAILSARILGLVLPGMATILTFYLAACLGMRFASRTGTLLAAGFNFSMVIPLGVALLHAVDPARPRPANAKAGIALALTALAAIVAAVVTTPLLGLTYLGLTLVVACLVRGDLPHVLNLSEEPSAGGRRASAIKSVDSFTPGVRPFAAGEAVTSGISGVPAMSPAGAPAHPPGGSRDELLLSRRRSVRAARSSRPARMRSRSSVCRWLLTRAFLNWRSLLCGGLLLQAGAMTLFGGRSILNATVLIVSYPGLVTAMNLHLLEGVAHLPVSRPRIFAALVLPGLLWLAIGVGIPIVVTSLGGGPQSGVHLDSRSIHTLGSEEHSRSLVQVPPSHWRTWNGGPIPVVVGPDQEERELTLHPLFPGATTAIYNPYESCDEWNRYRFDDLSSPELDEAIAEMRRKLDEARNRTEEAAGLEDLEEMLRQRQGLSQQWAEINFRDFRYRDEKRRLIELIPAWQLSRALADVHGIRVSPEEANGRFVDPYRNERAIDALRELVASRPSSAPRRLPGVILIVVLAWFLSLLPVMRSNRGRATRAGQRWSIAAVWISCGLLMVGLCVLMFRVARDQDLLRWYFHRITHAVTSPVPAYPWALWGLVVAVFAACWLILLRRFRHVEPPQNKKNPFTGREVVVR